MTKLLEIRIEAPESASPEGLSAAGKQAREAAILELQQRGDRGIRDAARELGLDYEGYLALLAERGLPVAHDDTDPAVLDTLRRSARSATVQSRSPSPRWRPA